MWVPWEIMAVQNGGKPRGLGGSRFLGSADTEVVVFVSRYQTELHCPCKLAEWDGAAGNGAGFSVRGRRKDHMSRELISLALWPFPPF